MGRTYWNHLSGPRILFVGKTLIAQFYMTIHSPYFLNGKLNLPRNFSISSSFLNFDINCLVASSVCLFMSIESVVVSPFSFLILINVPSLLFSISFLPGPYLFYQRVERTKFWLYQSSVLTVFFINYCSNHIFTF